MKIIEIPVTVKVKKSGNVGLDGEITFKEFCLMQIDTYSAIKTPGQIRQINKIAAALESEGTTIQLEDADHKLLIESLSEMKYVPGISRQLVSYLDAIEKAQDVKK